MLPCLDLNPLKLRLCERVLGPGKNVLGETGYIDFYVIRARRAITSNEVIDGADVVDKIANAQTDSRDRPVNDVVLQSVTIERG